MPEHASHIASAVENLAGVQGIAEEGLKLAEDSLGAQNTPQQEEERVFYAGRISARDPRYTVVPQRDRIRRQGHGESSTAMV